MYSIFKLLCLKKKDSKNIFQCLYKRTGKTHTHTQSEPELLEVGRGREEKNFQCLFILFLHMHAYICLHIKYIQILKLCQCIAFYQN